MPPLTIIAGCGYLGTFIARRLLAAQRPVLALTRHAASAAELVQSGIPAAACDLSNPDSLHALAANPSANLRAHPTVDATSDPAQPRIIHCAASGRGGRAEQYREVYLQGCRNLRAAFPHASRFFFTSSTSVYPQIAGETVTELSPADPSRETGRILRETENETLAAGGIVGRLAGIYGPDRSVLLKNFLAGTSAVDVRSEPPATPDGRWINQIHVEDAARAILHLLDLEEHPENPPAASRLYIIADSTPLLQRPLFAALAEKFALPMPPDAPPDLDRKRGWTHKKASNARLRSTGWQPLYPDWFSALDAGAILQPAS